MAQNDRPKDRWDKLQISALAFASVAVPVVLAFVANDHNQSIQRSQNEARLFEMAISILRDEPKDQTSALRSWAIEYFANQTKMKVPLPSDAKVELKSEVPYTYIDQFGTVYRYHDNYVGGDYFPAYSTKPDGQTSAEDCAKGQKCERPTLRIVVPVQRAASKAHEEKPKNEP